MSSTGSIIVKIAMANPGGFGASALPRDSTSRPPIPTGTRGATHRVRNGPVTSAVGAPMSNEYRMVFPVSAWSAAIAVIGPGCGGMRPCATESPAAMGSARRRMGVPVSFASMNTMGPSSTMPTPKKTEMPTTNATTIMA